MSLAACLPGMIERGEISRERGRRMGELFGQLEKHYAQSMGPEAAAAEASEQTLVKLAAEAALKKRQALLQASVQTRGLADMAKFQGNAPFKAIRAMLDDDLRAPYENVPRRAEAIEFRAQAGIREFIEKHRRNFLGKMQDRAGGDDVVRELHGEATGNARAATFARAIAETFEELRLRFNAAGGAIAKLANWGLPHRWSTMKVRGVSYERFREVFLPELDPARMRDPRDGGAMTDARLEEGLRAAYDNIRTNGLTGEPSSAFQGSGSAANQRAEHRFFVFKDADAWMRVHKEFGEGDVFTTIMGHISGMSHDIAMMERLGPNPDATMRLLMDAAGKQAQKADGKIVGTADKALTEAVWRFVKGEYSDPIVRETRAGRMAIGALGGLRNLSTAAKLGSAPVSALSDTSTQLLARKFSGLPQVRVIFDYLSQLNPASHADRRLAVDLELGMRDASRSLGGMAKFYGETNNPGWTAVVADDVLRLSGFNKWTEAGQRGFGLTFLRHLGSLRGKAFDALPSDLRATMGRYGFSAKDWEAARSSVPIEQGRATYIKAGNIGDRAAGDRLMDMVLGETAAAVPEPTTTARAVLSFGQRPGSISGELLKTSTQFKSFGVSLMMQQAQRIAALPPRARAQYAAQFFIGMTMFGALTIQLRELIKGNDLRPMFDDPNTPDNNEMKEFWADAFFQGGGLGIIGDLIGTFYNDRIDGVGQLLGGPVTGMFVDAKRAVDTSFDKVRKDGSVRAGNPGKAARRFVQRNLPGSTLWYIRAAVDRTILDALSAEIDPEYMDQRQQVEEWAARNGQGTWWAPGDPLGGHRAPDIDNAMRDGREYRQ